MNSTTIQMMTEGFISEHFLLWRCLHGRPICKETIDAWDPDSAMPWRALRERNVPLLQKLTEVYGACAVVALDGDQVVGQLRFYPKIVWQLARGGMLCMQQFPPDGPDEGFHANTFPPLNDLTEKTLVVHCLMTVRPALPENPYRRKGIGTRMVNMLIKWAGQNGWEAIEATAYADLEVLYQVTGQAGKNFWEKIGTPSSSFRVIETGVEEGFFQASDLMRAMQSEATAKGMDLNGITQKYIMRLELQPSGE